MFFFMENTLNLECRSVWQNELRSTIHYLSHAIILKNFVTNIQSDIFSSAFSIPLQQGTFDSIVTFMESNRLQNRSGTTINIIFPYQVGNMLCTALSSVLTGQDERKYKQFFPSATDSFSREDSTCSYNGDQTRLGRSEE